MSSTTSSDCGSCECSQCTYSFENDHNDYGQCTTNGRHVPIYATMAHPLIYYAQVQPINRRQYNDQPKKENPFKKAFKWYTQERKACCENEVAPERSGFANWLDNKYCEYLRESGQQPTSNEPRAPNTCVTNMCQCPKPTKRFRRFKSPWRKRTCPANDSGDVPQKCPDGSCEYILKPKELSRAASENCCHSPTSVVKSSTTIESSHMPCNAKCSRRSQSLSDVSREKYVHNKHVETIPLTVQEGTYISCECPQEQIVYPPLIKLEQVCDCLQQKVPEVVKVPSKQQDSRNQPEAACTCQKEKVPEPVKVKSKECETRNQPKPTCASQKEKIPVEVIVPSKQLDSRNRPELPCTCQNEKVRGSLKEPSKQLDSRNRPELPCTCQNEKVRGSLKEPSKQLDSRNRPELPCTCQNEKVRGSLKEPSKQLDSRNQPEPPCACQNEKVPVILKEPSIQLDSRNQPESPCPCQNEKVPVILKEPSIQLDSKNQPESPCPCQNEKVPVILKEPSIQLDSKNQPESPCPCQNEKVPVILKEPSIQLDSKNQPESPCPCQNEKVPVILKEPSIQLDSRNQPESPCPCQKEKVPEIVKEEQDSNNQPVAPCKCSQEKVPTEVKLPSCHEETPKVVEVQQEKIPEVIKVPSKAQEPTNKRKLCCSCEKVNVPKMVQVPSEDQDPGNLSRHCCSCHVKKVPEVVQVPSQCRAVEESCQSPEQVVVPVCGETQYETAPTALRDAQNHGPCCCNTCKPAPPPATQPLQPQICCIPVKVQDRKISSPDICLTVAPSVQFDSPKKQKKVKQCAITVATQCGEGIKPTVASQCQYEICECGKDNPSSHNCHEERQVFGTIPIKRESYSTVAVNKETGEYSIMKEVAVVNKLTRCVTCASNGAAQTSDHSIRFENDGACCSCPYPLFFKIVYADVAKN